MGRMTDYVELRCRSAFSFLDGASLPEDLAATAASLGHEALALGDRDGLYGAPRFFRAARRAGGLRPLVGADVTLAEGPPLLLLVLDRPGYKNLCRLLTAMKDGRPKGEGSASYQLLEEHKAGLVALAGGEPRQDLDRLLGIFGPGYLYGEVQRHLDDEEARRNR